MQPQQQQQEFIPGTRTEQSGSYQGASGNNNRMQDSAENVLSALVLAQTISDPKLFFLHFHPKI